MSGFYTDEQLKIHRELVKAGLESARQRGVRLGRPRLLSDEQIALGKTMKACGVAVKDICKELGISSSTYRRYLGQTKFRKIRGKSGKELAKTLTGLFS